MSTHAVTQAARFVPPASLLPEGNRLASSAAPETLVLGIPGFEFPDLFDPARLRDLHVEYERGFAARDGAAYAAFEAYRACGGKGMTPEAISLALTDAAPHVAAFVAKLFGVEREAKILADEVLERTPLWRFKKDFAKKRVLHAKAGEAARGAGLTEAAITRIARAAIAAFAPPGRDEELAVAEATLAIAQLHDVGQKVAKGGGAAWTPELLARAQTLSDAIGEADGAAAAKTALDAIEAYLAARHHDPNDPASRWPSLHLPKSLEPGSLVQIRRPEAATLPEAFVGEGHDPRERGGFSLTDRRMTAREAEEEIDYCVICHERDKDSCSKGMLEKPAKKAGAPSAAPEATTENVPPAVKRNALGVALEGCPLEEKISEMHMMRGRGDSLAALALVTLDNPTCAGTGHRICNDCMKACIFQKQEPVNIPQIETRVLTEVLSLPWGLEIYGLLTRWNPLNIQRPHAKEYVGKKILVVGLGPAGYTLSHHLAMEGFGVVAVDGLKIEPLPASLVGSRTESGDGKGYTAPNPVHDFHALYTQLDERVLLGFGGVSEYGITVRWDKNFLTVLYVTLARHRHLQIFGGVRFGGTLTLDDAWKLGFDHVAIAAGAGKPTIIPIKNNLSRGIRKASDFLMALQLTGAYKKSSIANLQIELPAIVIGGGLTAIDTATELLAYYLVQIDKTKERVDALRASGEWEAVERQLDGEEQDALAKLLEHATELEAERALAAEEKRDPKTQKLLAKWGGVSLVYRKTLNDSPAYRLNHEEVQKSLEEGVRYIENLSPLEAVIDDRGHVAGMKFERRDKSVTFLPARTVCVAAGTSPNVTYEREYQGTFQLDARGQFFLAHKADRGADGKVTLSPVPDGRDAFFTSFHDGKHAVSFYGDNHPHYAGSVVRAMASAKDGFPQVVSLFPELAALDPSTQRARNQELQSFFAAMEDEFKATIVAVNRLTPSIVEVVVHAPMAARKFEPGQFYRLQNFEILAPVVEGTRLAMEGLALTGAWIDREKGLMGTIVLEMGGSSRLCAALKPGEPVVLMGPTGTPTEIEKNETVLLAGGGLGNAVLFSIARAMKALGSTVLYFAGYKKGEDLFKQEEIERFTDQVIWCTDTGKAVVPSRPGDAHFRGNIVQAMIAYAEGSIGGRLVDMQKVDRVIAIGSDRMMAAVKEARHGVLAASLKKGHRAIGSINSPMQCMMKEICAQCLQKHKDPETGKESLVFSCSNQDQDLDRVDFAHLASRLRSNSLQEKISNAWLDHVLASRPDLLRV